jgi:hypothetical protein
LAIGVRRARLDDDGVASGGFFGYSVVAGTSVWILYDSETVCLESGSYCVDMGHYLPTSGYFYGHIPSLGQGEGQHSEEWLPTGYYFSPPRCSCCPHKLPGELVTHPGRRMVPSVFGFYNASNIQDD